jgi:4'-phosphopantetheinyl transferase EntD
MPDGGLLRALRGLVPEGAGLGWADPQGIHDLLPGEDAQGMVPKRLRAFAAGRAAARRALAELGLAAEAIPKGPDRAPHWPIGIAGSISHSATQCLAVVIPAGLCRGIGLDLEEDSPLNETLWDTVLRPEERHGMTGAEAKLIFSAKEAAFKAQYPISRQLYGFDGMRIERDGALFTAIFAQAVPPFAVGDRIRGQMAHAAGHLVTLAHL